MSDLLCPICETFEAQTLAGLKSHVKSCERRPSVEELRRCCEEGMSPTAISEEYGAEITTVRRWLKEAGLEEQAGGRRRSADQLKVYRGLAAKCGGRCMDKRGRPICEIIDFCRFMTINYGWSFCEAPDQAQRDALERQGVDLLQLTTEVWVRHPGPWKENGR